MNQKLDDLLQMALLTPRTIRENSEELSAGYHVDTKSWEVMVKYHGAPESIRERGILMEELIANYAILLIPEERLEEIAAMEEIEYLEKPKCFSFEQTDPVRDSCIQELPGRGFSLSGQGVLIAVIDSGIDYTLPEFRTKSGGSRIFSLWDQSLPGREEFGPGREFDREKIMEALAEKDPERRFELVPSVDVSGHGTAVAGIAAGRSDGYRGVAGDADLLVVKLGNVGRSGFSQSTDICRGVAWALRKAEKYKMPLVINLSYGSTYGAHDGSSLMERFLDNAAEIGRTVICVGSGNEGSSGGHCRGKLSPGRERETQLRIGAYVRDLGLQLWTFYSDDLVIGIRSPGGQQAVFEPAEQRGVRMVRLEGTMLELFFGEPSPYSVNREIYVNFQPGSDRYVTEGIWILTLRSTRMVMGTYSFYLTAQSREGAAAFLQPTVTEGTLTIPSTAAKVITVGAYDSTYGAYAEFSGRGWKGDGDIGHVKPDLVAPGVGVRAPWGGNYGYFTGTSFATPVVAGAAALLMEWGIVQGHDSYLYGEKCKAYLHRGAKAVLGEENYPNEKVGWGRLCVERSLPE